MFAALGMQAFVERARRELLHADLIVGSFVAAFPPGAELSAADIRRIPGTD